MPVRAAVPAAAAPVPSDPDLVERYRAQHRRYVALYPALKAAGAVRRRALSQGGISP